MAIITLALAIATTVSAFTLIDRVLIRPLDVRDSSRVVAVQQIVERSGVDFRSTGMTWDFYQQLLEASMSAVEGLAASNDMADRVSDRLAVAFGDDAAPDYVRGLFVTANYFRVLGMAPLAGRDFAAGDDTGGPAPAILSYRLWRTRFGGDTGFLGRMIRVNGIPVRLIGVAPRTFTGTDLSSTPPDLFLPLMTAPRFMESSSSLQFDSQSRFFTPGFPGAVPSPISPIARLMIIGRLNEGGSVEQAQAELRRLVDPEAELAIVPLSDMMLPFQSRLEIVHFLGLLAAAVGLTLLVGCANLASFLISRVEARRADLAVRSALGAGRGALVREVTVEAAVVALAGGFTGIVVAHWISGAMASLALPGGIALSVLREGIDGRAILFTALATTFATIVISIGPAWRGATVEFAGGLRRTGGAASLRATLLIVGVQVTLCVVLVFGAMLFVRSVSEALRAEMGFDSDGLFSVSARPPLLSPSQGFVMLRSIDAFADIVGELPGVSGVTIGPMPLARGSDRSVDQIRVGESLLDLPTALEVSYSGSEYFATLGQDVIRGRDFEESDAADTSVVGIVNESAARRLWPDRDPLGELVAISSSSAPIEVVGVVRDVRDLRGQARMAIYLSRNQHGAYLAGSLTASGEGFLILRAASASESVIESLGQAAVDAGLSLGDVVAVDDQIAAILGPQRLGRAVMSWLGAIALMLAGVGIYGMLSCAVARAEKEIGIRRALGASATSAMYVIVMRTLSPVLVGIVGGSALAWWGGRFADRFMYGISGSDPTTIFLAVATLAIVACSAALIPMQRVIRANPVDALRGDTH